jgi:hypothetical protein
MLITVRNNINTNIPDIKTSSPRLTTYVVAFTRLELQYPQAVLAGTTTNPSHSVQAIVNVYTPLLFFTRDMPPVNEVKLPRLSIRADTVKGFETDVLGTTSGVPEVIIAICPALSEIVIVRLELKNDGVITNGT